MYLSVPQSVANPPHEAAALREHEQSIRKALQDAYGSSFAAIQQASGGGLAVGSSFRGSEARGPSLSQHDAPAFAGDSRSGDKPVRWGPEPHAQQIKAYERVASTALAACAIPPDLVLGGADGASAKENFRQFYLLGVQSLAAIIEAEVRLKLGDIKLGFDKLLASDIQARSRAYAQFLAGGMSSQAALELVGLQMPADKE